MISMIDMNNHIDNEELFRRNLKNQLFYFLVFYLEIDTHPIVGVIEFVEDRNVFLHYHKYFSRIY